MTTITPSLTIEPTCAPLDGDTPGYVVAEAVTPDGRDVRAVVESEEYPDAPVNDGGAATFALEPQFFGHYARPVYGATDDAWPALGGHVEDLRRTLTDYVSRHGLVQGVEIFTRYVRAFHDGHVRTYSPYYADNVYVAVTTRRLADVWGCDDVPEASLTEWRAYCEGEVYGVRAEVYVPEVETHHVATLAGVDDVETETGDGAWVTVPETDCWGYYGRESAEEAARETLTRLNLDTLPTA